MTKITTRTKIILMLIFMAVVYILFFVLFSFNYPEDIKSYEELVLSNKSVQNYFGVIKTIRPKMIGGDRSSKGGESGSDCFSVKGSTKKGNIKVSWIKENDKVKITMISTREGLCSTRIIWPEPIGLQSSYILPSNIWDGIILLIITFVIVVLYFNIKKVGMFVTFFFPSVVWTEKIQVVFKWILLALTFGYLSYSILCFLDIYTLF